MKGKQKKREKDDYFDWHHTFPVSRFKKRKRRKLHVPWHSLFEDMMPYEAIEQIEKWTTLEGSLTKKLGKNKQEAWKIVFGPQTSPKEAIEIVKREWSPPRRVTKRVICGLSRLLNSKKAL